MHEPQRRMCSARPGELGERFSGAIGVIDRVDWARRLKHNVQ